MSTHKKVIFKLSDAGQVESELPSKYAPIQAKAIIKKPSPLREPLQSSNSLRYHRVNSSVNFTKDSKASNYSPNKSGREEGLVGTAPNEISQQKTREDEKHNIEKRSLAGMKPRSNVQSNTRVPSGRPSIGGQEQSFIKENQATRYQAPLKARRSGGGGAEPQSAITLLPSSSFTGKLIERSRQKVVEKHQNHNQTMIERERANVERERALAQQDQLLSMIALTKNEMLKDKNVIRKYMDKHKQNMDQLEKQHIDPLYKMKGIWSVLKEPSQSNGPQFITYDKSRSFTHYKKILFNSQSEN